MMYQQTKNIKYLGYALIPLSASVASQFSAALVLIPWAVFALTVIIQSQRFEKRRQILFILKYCAASIALYLLLTPGIIIYFNRTIQYIGGLMGWTDSVTAQAGSKSSYATVKDINLWTAYAKYMVHFYGKFNLALLAVSAGLILWKRQWKLIYPFSILVIFYLILANASQTTYAGRYIIPGLFLGYILMPFLIVEIFHHAKGWQARWRYILMTIILSVILLNFGRNAVLAIEGVRQYGFPDTRILMSKWLESNCRDDETILLEDNVNFPRLDSRRTTYVDHWNAYPPLDSVSTEIVIINMNHIRHLNSMGTETPYQRFYNNLRHSAEWTIIHSEKPQRGKTIGPELLAFRSN
jgi:hypothetical protein